MTARPRLVVCSIGHVTDPDAVMDVRTNRPYEARGLGGLAIHVPPNYLENGGPQWLSSCRYVFQLGPQSREHQCRRRIIGPLDTQPALEAAYRLGGAKAVHEIFMARSQGDGRE